MTKTTRNEERERKRGIFYSDEQFPPDVKPSAKRNRIFSLPEVLQPRKRYSWTDISLDIARKGERDRRNSDSSVEPPFRRHSWSSGSSGCGLFAKDACKVTRKISQDSRHGSSSASIPDIIEECSSDDESPDESRTSVQVARELRCRYCFQKDSTVMFVKNEKYPYCKKCRDLLRNRSKFGNMIPFYNIADSRKTHTMDYLSASPPKRSRKTSLPESLDLPRIEEPVTGEEGTDTKEMQLIVEKEVHKLLSFGSKGDKSLFYNEKRRNSDNDLDLITVNFKKMLIQKNADLIP